jgi:hypothetical protein
MSLLIHCIILLNYLKSLLIKKGLILKKESSNKKSILKFEIYLVFFISNQQTKQSKQSNQQPTLSKHSQNTLKTLSQHTQKSHVLSLAPRRTLPLSLPD